MEPKNVMAKYSKHALSPINVVSIVRIIGFNNGDAIMKLITDPKGAPALSNPTVIGIVEHAQKGVNAPTIDAKTFPQSLFLITNCLTFHQIRVSKVKILKC